MPRHRALRGSLLSFSDHPARPGAVRYVEDGLLVIADGRIAQCGESAALLPALPPGTPLDDWRGRLVLPGFVDCHTHFVQADIVASHGESLLGWLERYAFPAEARYADGERAGEAAAFVLDELLRNGTTTAMVFGSVHAASVDALFGAASERRMRLIAGKVLMDCNCPEALRDSAQSGYDDSLALIRRWHGKERLAYALTPRFAASSSPEQLEAAAALYRAHPGVYVQSHLAETREEVELVRSRFPEARSYTDVYARFGLLGPRAVYGHGIWLDDGERSQLADTGSAIAFCPSSNLFLGSGHFDLDAAEALHVRVGLGTDVGAGVSFSVLATLADGYKSARLAGRTLEPLRAFYLATLGGARALRLEDRIGSFEPGREADCVVLDPRATPLLARRTARSTSLEETLFALMMLGDGHAVAATYLQGELWSRKRGQDPFQ
jgi:guanine deaminase